MWELDSEESWALKNWCFWTVVFEKTLESPLDSEGIQPVHLKGNRSWIFIGRTDGWTWSSNPLVTWCKEVTHLKRSWCWKRLKVGGEEDDRGWDGWMASLTQWTWVWVSSGSWWWRRRPGIHTAVCGVAKSQTQLRTELIWADTISEVHVLQRYIF